MLINFHSLQHQYDWSCILTIFSLPEIDECATGTHGCEQICINTMGGYKCDCKLGYELHSDGKKCEGQLSGQCIAHTDQFLRENNNNTKKKPTIQQVK